MARKKKIQHCRKHAPEQEELELLINSAENPRDKALLILLSIGLRESEAAHCLPEWVHVGDKEALHFGADFINIPKLSKQCNCNDCLHREFIDRLQDKSPDKKHSLEWFIKMSARFYRLKRKDKALIKAGKEPKFIFKQIMEKNEKGRIVKRFVPRHPHYWSPKTEQGARMVWILNREHANYVNEYFKENESLGLQRRSIYVVIRKLGKKILDKKLFPHAIRSTAITKMAYAGLSAPTINTQAGWATNLAETYVSTSPLLALLDMRSKMGDTR